MITIQKTTSLLFSACILFATQLCNGQIPTRDISLEDLDALEQLAEDNDVFQTIHIEPPSPFMIKVRQWGMPLFLAFCSVYEKLNNAGQWIRNQFNATC